MLDLLDYNDRIDDDGFILFLDFCKAFDRVEHPFILDTWQHFGFGECFREIIRMLYSDINSSVLSGTCSRFEVKRGIRQGCPASPLLFIMSAEILAILLKNCEDVQHLNVMGHSFIVSQLADDTTKNEAQIPKALEVISSFSESSGLQLNLKKCELMAIHDHPLTSIAGIPIKNEVKYLGITISKDLKYREKTNFEDILKKSKTILHTWLQRDLSIFGRISLSKMEGLSRLIYPAYSLDIPDNITKLINQNILISFGKIDTIILERTMLLNLLKKEVLMLLILSP